MPNTRFYLPRNEGNEVPQRWLFFDTETKTTPTENGDELLTLDFGMATFWAPQRAGRNEQLHHYSFTAPLSFVQLAHKLAVPNSRLVICAHNIQFDAAVVGLLPNLVDLGWRITYFVSEHGKQLYHLRSEKRTIICVDSYNWFPFSLAEIGNRIGLEKLPMPPPDAPPQARYEYCQRDVQILYRAVRSWVEQVQRDDLGNFSFTLAGQAMNAYRHRFMPTNILIDQDADKRNFARSAFYGGRTEAYHLGRLSPGRYTMLDVNSLYPSVMQQEKFPTRQIADDRHPTMAFAGEQFSLTQMIADVEIETDVPYYPKRHNGYLAFPIGRFRTTLAGPELFLASENGHIRNVYRWAAYNMEPLFFDYVDYFYDKRRAYLENGDVIGAAIAKSLLTNLYGKFGQRTPVWSAVSTDASRQYAAWQEYHVQSGEWREYRTIGGNVYQRSDSRDAHFSIPSIAAFVTSYGRLALLRLIRLAGWEHVFYVDTDSLLVDIHGMDCLGSLCDRARLGALKIVWQDDDVEIYGLKSYRHGAEIKASGLRSGSTLLPDGTFATRDFWGLTHNWSAGVREGVIVHHYVKSLTRTYAKGIVQATGAVAPLVLGSQQ